MKKIDNPLRIKITGVCNRCCSFCHHEGGDNQIEEIIPSAVLGYDIKKLCQKLNINSVALTGGEPLMHSNLIALAEFLQSEVEIGKFYMTSNGIIRKETSFWKDLKKLGLQKVNISVPDVMAEYKRNSSITGDVFQNQLQNIKEINDIEVNVDVNVVVFSDYLYTKYVIDTLNALKAQGLVFHIYLLPNLSPDKYEYSTMIIDRVLKNMGYKKDYTCSGESISNTSKRYHDAAGNQLFVKTTEKNQKVYQLSGFCDKCEKKTICREGFYGLRLEKRQGIHYIRTCLIRDTEDTLIPLSRFFSSDIYKLLLKKWGDTV